MFWLALVFPEWPLQARFRGRPGTQALAIEERQRVVALDATALAQGVRIGQRLADALALAPDLLIRARDRAAEAQALHEAAGCALQFTPHVALDEAGLLLEVEGSLMLFGGLSRLLHCLRQSLSAAGFRLQLAGAPTPLAARWLALGAPGSMVRDDASLRAALVTLPLEVIEAGSALSMLKDAGLRTLGNAMELPRSALALREARSVLGLLDRALGQQADPRGFFSPPRRIDSRLELPVPRHDTDVLLFVASRLFNAACNRLAAEHAGVGECRLELQHEHAAPTILELCTGVPTRDAHRLTLLTREHLARIVLPEAVCALRLQSDNWVTLAGRSRELFGAQVRSTDDLREAADLLVERLRARLGREAVHGLSGCGDHRPERAQRIDEPTHARPARARAQRPLWLLVQPQALAERDGHPWRNGPLHCIGRAERIEAGWWDDETAAPGESLRDYYVAIGPGQERLWIYREHTPPWRWFLHGIFA